MPRFNTSRSVPHSAAEMFDLVADVERYPDFLPYCEGLVVRARRLQEAKEVVIADMTVGYKVVRETFTSRILVDRSALSIDVAATEGPFRTLTNSWRFVDNTSVAPRAPVSGSLSQGLTGALSTGQGSTVGFEISWEFKSRFLGNLVGSLFDRAFRKYADAFEARARDVYGARAA